MILKSLGIAIELCDISAPGMEEQRDFMRANATKKENQRNVLPPQVFNGEKYCGDYDAFDVANEDDGLKSSWESPGNIQRLSQQRRNLQRKAKKRRSQQLRARRRRVRRHQSLKEKLLLQKEKLLLQHLQRRRPLLLRSREKWDRSSEAAKAIVIPSLCSFLPVSIGPSIC